MTAIGLVGTGFWAETIHAPSIGALEGPAQHGIWGRDAAARERLAQAFGIRPYASFEELLAAVDVVDFAIPPAAQVPMAITAAEAGRHLLLEKPMAISSPDARRLHATVAASGVVAIVFLTRLFEPARAAWLLQQARRGHTNGHVEWISAALSAGSPYAASTWRREGGALWDVGPHVVSQLAAVLGPIVAVSVASHDPDGSTRLVLDHEGGAVSTVNMTVHADPADKAETFEFWGRSGRARSPATPLDFPAAFEVALATFVRSIVDGSVPMGAPYSTAQGVVMTNVLGTIDALLHSGTRHVAVPVTTEP